MKKKNIIKSLLTFVFLLAIGFAFNEDINTYSNYLANSTADFKTTKNEKLLTTTSAIINTFTDDTIIGNTSCQSYDTTVRCQIFAMLPESATKYKAFLTSKNNTSMIELGELQKSNEGIYILESTLEKHNVGDSILITNGKSKIGYAKFSTLGF